jgi:hypothetical protein
MFFMSYSFLHILLTISGLERFSRVYLCVTIVPNLPCTCSRDAPRRVLPPHCPLIFPFLFSYRLSSVLYGQLTLRFTFLSLSIIFNTHPSFLLLLCLVISTLSY